MNGTCQYGSRCNFLHTSVDGEYVSPAKKAERSSVFYFHPSEWCPQLIMFFPQRFRASGNSEEDATSGRIVICQLIFSVEL
jgi:hypothetical protein